MKLATKARTGLLGSLATLFVLAIAPAASAETVTAIQTTDVTIPTSGNGAPYPSVANLEGADGNITEITVNLTLSHTRPADVDIVLVSPDGDSEVILSDACGNADLASAIFSFKNDAIATLPAESCVSGTYLPTNVDTTENWPGPGPGVVTTALLNNFVGEDPNGEWKLFVIDDTAGEAGTVLQWSVSVVTATAEVIVPGTGTSGAASPYPSTKTFDTPAGKVISDVNFTTPDFNHLNPDDVDMLLVGPWEGATAMLMSDACGSDDIHDYSWTFDDEAGALMSDNVIAGCNPFGIKPSDFEIPDVFPGPAPAGPYGSALSEFDGLEGGEWSLFVNDDTALATGFLTSWALQVTTRDAADTGFTVSTVSVAEGGSAKLEVTRTGPAQLGPATLAVTTGGSATAGADYTAPPTTLEFARLEKTKTIEIPVAADSTLEAQESIAVALSSPWDDARLTGTAVATVEIPAQSAPLNPTQTTPTAPSNKFSFGKVQKDPKKGTAKLFVNVPGAGSLALTGKQVKSATAKASAGGSVALVVKAKGKGLAKLEEDGSVQLTANVTFTPTGGSALTLPKKLKLALND